MNELPHTRDLTTALEILGRWEQESDVEVKMLASIGYHNCLLKSKADQSEAIETLRGYFPSYGPDYEGKRQAAFAGLVLLGQLEILRDSRESIAWEGQRVIVPIERGLKRNFVLIEFIAANWDALKKGLGSDLQVWFTRPPHEGHFWTTMSIVASQYPLVASDLSAVFAVNDSLTKTAGGLSFVARSMPRSTSLLNSCLSVLKSDSNDYGWLGRVETAAKIIATSSLIMPVWVLDWWRQLKHKNMSIVLV